MPHLFYMDKELLTLETIYHTTISMDFRLIFKWIYAFYISHSSYNLFSTNHHKFAKLISSRLWAFVHKQHFQSSVGEKQFFYRCMLPSIPSSTHPPKFHYVVLELRNLELINFISTQIRVYSESIQITQNLI